MLLRAVALGSAQAVEQVTVEAKHWSPATIAALRDWLSEHKFGGDLARSLVEWREAGAPGLT